MEETKSMSREEKRQEPLRLDATVNTKLNLADFQNAVPLLRELIIVNETAEELRDLDLSVSSVPPFIKSKVWRVDVVGRSQHYRIPELDVQLDGILLTRLTEAEHATVFFALHSRNLEKTKLASHQVSIELLPRNQWGGLSHLPEMVAAFVQPNEPPIELLLKNAADVLRTNGKNAALDGYTGGPKRAWELASAIWTVVAGMGLDYALPPASFEHTGQKVRGPEKIAESGLATCLDLVLLFCSALEQAGLNSLLIFTKGHAFAGIWLKAEDFSTTVVDDVTALRTRVKLKEMVLFETTVATERPAPTFSRAVELGALLLSEANDEGFELAVDVRRARLQRIKPLASAESLAGSGSIEHSPVQGPNFEEAPDDLPQDNDPGTLGPESLRVEDRLARWQRKLLDLSLRNNLLNFKQSKNVLTLDAPDPSGLEDLLAGGHSIKLLPRPDLMDGADPRNQAIYEGREREDVRRGHATDALKRREVFVSIGSDELAARLVDLYRTTRTSLQEGGANTLFLAVGFLSWTGEGREGRRYRAPLVLIPVALNRQSVRSGFSLTLHDDEPRFNPTLIEMLHQDFKLNLGVSNDELPKDDAGLDIAGIWKTVRQAIKDINGWEVTEEVVLSTFSFAKYLMWKDLTERTAQLRENSVIRHLLDTPRDSFPSGTAFPNPRRLDAEYNPEQTFCPLPADSSQLSAVMAAARGKDFVLIGPPGTGKSQTISNLIAQCIAEGKKVLFVSEKMAALDVVYRRLREVGLGEFCLEVHSNKARKTDVLAQLQRAWGAQSENDPEVWKAEADRLKTLREQLNLYVERLHLRRSNGISIYEAIGQVSSGTDVPVLRLAWNSPSAHNTSDMKKMREVVALLAVNATAVSTSPFQTNSFAVNLSIDWSPSWQRRLVEAAQELCRAADESHRAYEKFTLSTGLPAVPTNARTRAAIGEIALSLPSAFGHDWRFVLRQDAKGICNELQSVIAELEKHQKLTDGLSQDWTDTTVRACHRGIELLSQRKSILSQLSGQWTEEVCAALKRGLERLEEVSDLRTQLSVQYSGEIDQHNILYLERQWAKAEKTIWPMSALGKRRIRAILDPLVETAGVPDFGRDLRLLVTIRGLRSEISAIDIEASTDGLWAGEKTRPVLALCGLRFRDALIQARLGQDWTDSDFDPIDAGHCGERLKRQLEQVRALRALDHELAAMETMGPATSGLWMGHGTDVMSLEAALRFQVELRALRRSGATVGEHVEVARGDCGSIMTADLLRLQRRAEVERRLSEFSHLQEVTTGLWDGLQTSVESVSTAINLHVALSTALTDIAGAPEGTADIRGPLLHLLGDANSRLGPFGEVDEAGQHYLAACNALEPLLAQFEAIASNSRECTQTFRKLTLTELAENTRVLVSSESNLRAWCAWRKARAQAVELGMAPLVDSIDNGVVAPEAVHSAFETNYCRWWLNAIVDEDDVIRTFVSAEHEKRISDFRELDDRFTGLTRAFVRARLCAELPGQDSVARTSDWGILRHEINKKKCHMPLRELIARIPSVVTQLTPCLLMSPLSIAQYLATDTTCFDIVVFDEASQIPVWDAIGAIARGKQVVMVGDPKQLPPTNFFDKAESDADDEDIEGDLESILDECLSANLPVMNLAWHYRSRTENLIAFSNHHYYGGSLVTFPSPTAADLGVSFHHIAGVYEKGGARINKLEAKALVADLVARLKSAGFRESRLTIGVVTFNSQQQALIEDLLDEERRKDPSLEPFFAEGELEPVFVKNLENVQGDERDIMYFSITFGPDLTGVVSMNFGPMNRQGGERRLNVAITRSRHELRVFSSLRADQIDLARTRATGVRDLKYFLDFAARGSRALAEARRDTMRDFDSPFEEAVSSALTNKGWEVHRQIGTSVYRIDLAIVHPDAPGIYLTGIECDGATYHRSSTARDRDKLREQILRGLGWEILRIWSTDWWIDKSGTLEKVHTRIEALLEESRVKRAAAKMLARASQFPDPLSKESNPPTPVITSRPARIAEQPGIGGVRPLPTTIESPATYAVRVGPQSEQSPVQFGKSDPASTVGGVNPDAFFDDAYDGVLREMITHLVNAEGPILDAVLASRVARAHNWQRTGSRIKARVEAIASSMFAMTNEDVGCFYWANNCGPEIPIRYRRSAGDTARAVQEICMEELIALAKEVRDGGETGDAAVVSMARKIGLQQLRRSSRDRIETALRAVGDLVGTS